MSDNDRATQAEQLIARMQAARGYIYPEWELAARTDPDFTEAYNRIYELALGEGRHVSAKVREFVAIAILAFRGADREGLVAHTQRAIRLGATREELGAGCSTVLLWTLRRSARAGRAAGRARRRGVRRRAGAGRRPVNPAGSV